MTVVFLSRLGVDVFVWTIAFTVAGACSLGLWQLRSGQWICSALNSSANWLFSCLSSSVGQVFLECKKAALMALDWKVHNSRNFAGRCSAGCLPGQAFQLTVVTLAIMPSECCRLCALVTAGCAFPCFQIFEAACPSPCRVHLYML